MTTFPHTTSDEPPDPSRATLIYRTDDGQLHTTEVFDTFLNEMYGHLRTTENERLLVILTSAYFELFTNTFIQRHCKNAKRILSDSRTYPWSAKKVILAELGVISEDHLKVLDWFRGLRNRAAHRDQFEITEKDVAEWPLPEKVGPFEMAGITLKHGNGGFRAVCLELISSWLGADAALLAAVLNDPDDVPRTK